MVNKKTAEIQAKYKFRGRVVDVAGTLLGLLIKWGTLALIVYFGRDAVVALAGKTTFADIGLNLLGKIEISQTIQIVATGGAIFWAVSERRIRHSKTAYLAGRLKQYETRLDPKRSSSRLTPSGTTRPEDRD